MVAQWLRANSPKRVPPSFLTKLTCLSSVCHWLPDNFCLHPEEAARCLSGEAVDNYAVSVYPSVALPVFAKHPVSVEQDGNPLDVVDEGGGGGGGGGFGGLWSTLRNMLTGRVAPSAATTTYTTPNGYTMNIPDGIIPEGYVVSPARNGRGLVFHAPETDPSSNINILRIMEPNSRNPDGYLVYYNHMGQPLDINGHPTARSNWHILFSQAGITIQPPAGANPDR